MTRYNKGTWIVILLTFKQNGTRMTFQEMKKQKATNVVVNENAEWSVYRQKNVKE